MSTSAIAASVGFLLGGASSYYYFNTRCKTTQKHILERNKENAKAFYDLIFNQNKPREGINKYVGDYYRQHNPDVGDGKEEFINYFERMTEGYPNKKVLFKRAIAEDNYVVLHCHQIWPSMPEEYAGIDIFKFDDNGKVIEHWDVLQTLPKDGKAKHNNGMF